MKTQQGFTVIELLVVAIVLAIGARFLGNPMALVFGSPRSIAMRSAENYSKAIKGAGGGDLRVADCLVFDNDGNDKISCSFVLPIATEQSLMIRRECESSWGARVWGGSCSDPSSTVIER
jgi:prepilin-type N-terminal cleavage/methylation domain-containing protein